MHVGNGLPPDPGARSLREAGPGRRRDAARLLKGFQPDLRAGRRPCSLEPPQPHTLILKPAPGGSPTVWQPSADENPDSHPVLPAGSGRLPGAPEGHGRRAAGRRPRGRSRDGAAELSERPHLRGLPRPLLRQRARRAAGDPPRLAVRGTRRRDREARELSLLRRDERRRADPRPAARRHLRRVSAALPRHHRLAGGDCLGPALDSQHLRPLAGFGARAGRARGGHRAQAGREARALHLPSCEPDHRRHGRHRLHADQRQGGAQGQDPVPAQRRRHRPLPPAPSGSLRAGALRHRRQADRAVRRDDGLCPQHRGDPRRSGAAARAPRGIRARGRRIRACARRAASRTRAAFPT